MRHFLSLSEKFVYLQIYCIISDIISIIFLLIFSNILKADWNVVSMKNGKVTYILSKFLGNIFFWDIVWKIIIKIKNSKF